MYCIHCSTYCTVYNDKKLYLYTVLTLIYILSDIDTIDETVRRNAVISFIHNFGQMPRQLFKRPHRSRKVFAGTAIGNPTIDQSSLGTLVPQVFFKNIAQLLPSKEPVKGERGGRERWRERGRETDGEMEAEKDRARGFLQKVCK